MHELSDLTTASLVHMYSTHRVSQHTVNVKVIAEMLSSLEHA